MDAAEVKEEGEVAVKEAMQILWYQANLMIPMKIGKYKEKSLLNWVGYTMQQRWTDTDTTSDMSSCSSPCPKQWRLLSALKLKRPIDFGLERTIPSRFHCPDQLIVWSHCDEEYWNDEIMWLQSVQNH